MKDPLFQPITINTMTVKNRIYMPAMHLGMARNYQITDQIIAFYRERARGGAGMICAGFATVDELSGNMLTIGAHDDKHISGLSRLAQAIHEYDARAVIQINHAGRYNMSMLMGGKKPIAPSPVASRITKEEPREMTLEDIARTIDAFAKAAGRVKTAGFDAVEVLSGTGYLISEFMSPLTNKRGDEYGGSFENRIRFGLEVMRAIRAEVGDEFPLIVRMNGNDFMPGGQGRDELREYAHRLTQESVNALCINVGWHEARVPQIVTGVPRGVYAYLARGIKDRVDVPVIASHRINDPHVAREMIGDGMCDMVAMGRSLIADPDLPNKAAAGKEDRIIHCVACAQGCFDHLFKMRHVECLCNPKAGHEHEPKAKFELVETPKKVMIVGGGPAGMSAALAALERGHHVCLYEREERLGGQLFLAAAPPGRAEFAELAHDLERQVLFSAIRVEVGDAADAAALDKEQPDVVVVATGAVPQTPPIPGGELDHVVDAWDVLLDKVATGKRVIVIGGGAVGVETAHFLAEKGTLSPESLKFLMINRAEDFESLYKQAIHGTKQVTLLEMIDAVGKDIGKSTRWGMMQDIARLGVQIKTKAKALEITADVVRVAIDGEEQSLPADTVVLATGAVPYNPLADLLEERGITTHVVGDAKKIGLAFDAIHQGYKTGRAIE